MNGLTCAVPTTKLDAPVQSVLPGFEAPEPESEQLTIFDIINDSESTPLEDTNESQEEEEPGVPLCVIYDWENDAPIEFRSLKGEVSGGMKKFYAVIGNPPYQEETEGNNRSKPIYNYFMEESYKVGDRVELITPARFLFNAGQTPKAWNRKMLEDPHLKVLLYESKGNTIFPNTEIKGGIAITYRESGKSYHPIKTFIAFDELKSILPKVSAESNGTLSDIFIGAVPYSFTSAVRNEHPELVTTIGNSFDLRTNILDKLAGTIFFTTKPSDGREYVKIFGLYMNWLRSFDTNERWLAKAHA
jgi:hypothetical protein